MMDGNLTSLARWGERLLRLLLEEEELDAVLGDFAEEHAGQVQKHGEWKAGLWYWIQLVRSSGSLVRLKIRRKIERRTLMGNNMHRQDLRRIGVGVIAVLPALLVIVPGILQSGFGITQINDGLDATFDRFPLLGVMIHPAVLLGGLLLACGLNLIPVVGLRWVRDDRGLSATITFRNQLLHWALVTFSLICLATLLGYSLTENFILVAR